MKFEFKSRFDLKILFTYEAENIRLALEMAVKARANLGGANLGGADLGGANLGGANLRGANLRGANLREADLRDANLGGADLRDADLGGANLRDADLGGADLVGAKNLRLPTGETWEEYLSETVPALLTAGGKKLDEVATEEVWNCHSWDNCPMALAFGVHAIAQIPPLYRQQASQFVSLFDGKQIPLAVVSGKKKFGEYAKEMSEKEGKR